MYAMKSMGVMVLDLQFGVIHPWFEGDKLPQMSLAICASTRGVDETGGVKRACRKVREARPKTDWEEEEEEDDEDEDEDEDEDKSLPLMRRDSDGGARVQVSGG